jgi:hypothetical protein
LTAKGEGPYGFSFEFRRTTPAVPAGLLSNRNGGAANDNDGFKAAYAAPVPNIRANPRRESGVLIVSPIYKALAFTAELGDQFVETERGITLF